MNTTKISVSKTNLLKANLEDVQKLIFKSLIGTVDFDCGSIQKFIPLLQEWMQAINSIISSSSDFNSDEFQKNPNSSHATNLKTKFVLVWSSSFLKSLISNFNVVFQKPNWCSKIKIKSLNDQDKNSGLDTVIILLLNILYAITNLILKFSNENIIGPKMVRVFGIDMVKDSISLICCLNRILLPQSVINVNKINFLMVFSFRNLADIAIKVLVMLDDSKINLNLQDNTDFIMNIINTIPTVGGDMEIQSQLIEFLFRVIPELLYLNNKSSSQSQYDFSDSFLKLKEKFDSDIINLLSNIDISDFDESCRLSLYKYINHTHDGINEFPTALIFQTAKIYSSDSIGTNDISNESLYVDIKPLQDSNYIWLSINKCTLSLIGKSSSSEEGVSVDIEYERLSSFELLLDSNKTKGIQLIVESIASNKNNAHNKSKIFDIYDLNEEDVENMKELNILNLIPNQNKLKNSQLLIDILTERIENQIKLSKENIIIDSQENSNEDNIKKNNKFDYSSTLSSSPLSSIKEETKSIKTSVPLTPIKIGKNLINNYTTKNDNRVPDILNKSYSSASSILSSYSLSGSSSTSTSSTQSESLSPTSSISNDKLNNKIKEEIKKRSKYKKIKTTKDIESRLENNEYKKRLRNKNNNQDEYNNKKKIKKNEVIKDNELIVVEEEEDEKGNKDDIGSSYGDNYDQLIPIEVESFINNRNQYQNKNTYNNNKSFNDKLNIIKQKEIIDIQGIPIKLRTDLNSILNDLSKSISSSFLTNVITINNSISKIINNIESIGSKYINEFSNSLVLNNKNQKKKSNNDNNKRTKLLLNLKSELILQLNLIENNTTLINSMESFINNSNLINFSQNSLNN